MKTKRLALGAGLAGIGVFTARSLGPKLHEHCQTMCAGNCCALDDKEGSAQQGCSPQTTCEVDQVA